MIYKYGVSKDVVLFDWAEAHQYDPIAQLILRVKGRLEDAAWAITEGKPELAYDILQQVVSDGADSVSKVRDTGDE